MLAHLAPRRLFSPQTRLAMSGPAILAAAAGMDALDDMFRAMADAALVAPARAKASPANEVWQPGMDLAAWLRATFADATPPRARHAALEARLETAAADLKRRFNRDFWIEEGQFFALALDGDQQRVDSLTSNTGHLLWSGIVEEDKIEACVRHLLGERRFSGWGVRTMAESTTSRMIAVSLRTAATVRVVYRVSTRAGCVVSTPALACPSQVSMSVL